MSNLDLHRQNMEEAHRAHDAVTAHYVAVNEGAIKTGEMSSFASIASLGVEHFRCRSATRQAVCDSLKASRGALRDMLIVPLILSTAVCPLSLPRGANGCSWL